MLNARQKRAGRRAACAAAGLLFLAVACVFPSGPVQAQARQRTIVIDPGHGGLDVGAKGQFGAQEKDITLALSFKLKDLIEKNLAYRVVLTRDNNIDVSLENRAAVANNNDAALFISHPHERVLPEEGPRRGDVLPEPEPTDEETRRLTRTLGRKIA